MEPYYWKTLHGDTTITRLRDPRKNNFSSKEIKAIFTSRSRASENTGEQVKQDQTIRELLDDFGERTSLMGVQQVTSRKGLRWKFFWILISLLAASMALYQSWNILQDFVGGKTVQSTAYSTYFDFPSVTVCANIHVHNTKKDLINETELLGLEKENLTMLVAMMEIIAAAENQSGTSLFGLNRIVRRCLYNRRSCDRNDENEFLYFDTLRFGNCFTYNPGIKKQKVSRPNYYVQMIINMEQTSRKKDYNDKYISLWLHPPGTPPVLYHTEAYHIYPGDSVDVKFQVKKIVRLTKSGSECTSDTEDPRRFQSIYYTNETEYIYAPKACVYSLIYDTKKAAYNCVDPCVPRNEKWWHDWNTGYYSICLPGTNRPTTESDDDNSNETLFDFDQNCSFPCNEWMIEYSITSTSSWFEALVDMSLKGNGNSKTDKNLNSISFDNSKAEIRIGLGSSMTEEVSEDYKYTVGDFAGIIGGNIGVWIGLCAISLAEVIELLIRMIANKLFKCGRVSSSQQQQQQSKRNTQVSQVRPPKRSSQLK